MFFKKSNKKNHILNTINDLRPVYIIGSSSLALYLGAKLKSAGLNILSITSKTEEKTFTLKEEYNLQKTICTLSSTTQIKEEPQLVIIASEAHNLKSNLTLLSSLRFPDTPILCFNHIENIKIIRPLLGRNFTQAYFNGYLDISGSTLSAYSPAPQITITASPDENKAEIFNNIFQQIEIKTFYENNDILNFWENFAPNALGYLLSFSKKHITEQLNDKETKKNIAKATAEICKLAANEQIALSAEDIIKQLLITPRNFYFKKDESRQQEAAKLDSFYTLLTDKARTYKCKTPELNLLMRNNYNKILKK